MSITSMAEVAFVRRVDVGISEVVPAIAVPTSFKKTELAIGGVPEAQTAISTALKLIVTYIPTEVLTLYVAILAVIRDPNAAGKPSPDIARRLEILFYIFLAVTPLVIWLVYAAKCKGGGKPVPWAVRSWPLWEMFAATVAYAAWAFALPENAFMDWYSPALAGVIVLIVSTVLGLFAPLCQRPISP